MFPSMLSETTISKTKVYKKKAGRYQTACGHWEICRATKGTRWVVFGRTPDEIPEEWVPIAAFENRRLCAEWIEGLKDSADHRAAIIASACKQSKADKRALVYAKPPGRPKSLTHRPAITITIEARHLEWLNQCPGSRSESIRDLIDYAMVYLPEPTK